MQHASASTAACFSIDGFVDEHGTCCRRRRVGRKRRSAARSPRRLRRLHQDFGPGRLQFMSEGGKRVMEVDDFAPLKGYPWPSFWEGSSNADAANAVETAKGTPRYWDVQVSPIFGTDGKPSHLLSIPRHHGGVAGHCRIEGSGQPPGTAFGRVTTPDQEHARDGRRDRKPDDARRECCVGSRSLFGPPYDVESRP